MAQHPCSTETSRVSWGVIDGVASVSGSMAASVAINRIDFSVSLPVIGFLKELSHAEDGVVIVATLLLLPTAALLYGGSKLIFAAKEAVEKKAVARGIQIGRQEEQERIRQVLASTGVQLTPVQEQALFQNGR